MSESPQTGRKNVEIANRKLGHEWINWDGRVRLKEAYLKESPLFIMMWLLVLLMIGVWFPTIIIYLIASQLTGSIGIMGLFIKLLFASFAISLSVLWCGLMLSWLTGRYLVPFSAIRKILCHITIRLYPIVDKLGQSRDRLGSSLVALCNELTYSMMKKGMGRSVLVLMPRCVSHYHKGEINEMAEQKGLKVHIAPKGEIARQKVIEFKPTVIIGIACERDLVTGIRDVDAKIPVLTIPLKMPSGPCKDTFIELAELKRVLERF